MSAIKPGSRFKRTRGAERSRGGLDQLGEEVEVEHGPFLVTIEPDVRVEQVRARYVSGPREGELVQWAVRYLELAFAPI